MRSYLAALLLVVALGGCGSGDAAAPAGAPAPALWAVIGRDGKPEGWLFGTVHALPDDFAWRSAVLDGALGDADMLVVEVGDLANGAEMGRLFESMAFGRAEGPIEERIDPALRADFAALVAKSGVERGYFDRMESWAAALTLAQLAQQARAENGVDRALIAAFAKRPVIELEGARGQLAIFDALPPAEQRDLLNAALEETRDYEREIAQLAADWRRGDIAALGAMTDRGILADPELHKALLTDRNRAWTGQIENLLSLEQKPFVAVGAGHLLGPEGLPAQLAAHGYTVRRIQ